MREKICHGLIFAAAAAAVLIFTACGEEAGALVFGNGAQTVIQITDIPATTTGYTYATAALTSVTDPATAKNKDDMGVSFPAEKISSNGTVNLRMYGAKASSGGLPAPASVTGSGILILFIHSNLKSDGTSDLEASSVKWQGWYYSGFSEGLNPSISFGSMTKFN